MKTIIATLTLIASVSFAKTAVPEICNLQSVDVEAEALFKIQSLDIKEINSLNAGLFKLVNYHLADLDYTADEITFEGVKELFSEGGEYESDDLIIDIMTSYKTGKKYILVNTWPGDNLYASIFDSKGKLIGKVNDGDYYLTTDGLSKTYCSDLLGK